MLARRFSVHAEAGIVVGVLLSRSGALDGDPEISIEENPRND
jgi:hypothetical protein